METPQGLIQHVQVLDQITAELEALLPTAPKHEEVGLEADKWARTLAALRRHRQLHDNALTAIRDTIRASIRHVNMLENQECKTAFDEWIDRILDASEVSEGACLHSWHTKSATAADTDLDQGSICRTPT